METDLTRFIKKELLLYYRYERDMIAVQECLNTDILVCDKSFNHFIEIEIKVSKSDLHNEFKKHKHHRPKCTYYILVPYNLKDEALIVAKKLNPDYGVMLFTENYPSFTTVKKAKRITSRNLERAVLNKLSSDYVKWYAKLQLYESDRFSNIPKMSNKATTVFTNLLRRYPSETVYNFEYIAKDDILIYGKHKIKFLKSSVVVDSKRFTYSSKWIENVLGEIDTWLSLEILKISGEKNGTHWNL